MTRREELADILHRAEVSVIPGPSDPPITSPHFPKDDRERYLRMADAILAWGKREEELNDNGRLVCMMSATMASAIMSNPAYNREALNPSRMVQLAIEMVSAVLSCPECRDVKDVHSGN